MSNLHSFLKADLWQQWAQIETDQKKRKPAPPVQKPYPPNATLVDLIPPGEFKIPDVSVFDAIARRRSHRNYTGQPLSQTELSFLLWATQGVRDVLVDGKYTLRTVPSAGARHPFETYILAQQVTGLDPALYRYLPVEHKLLFMQRIEDLAVKVWAATDTFFRECAVIFLWTVIPYRTEWRYGSISPKLIALDAGHVCENLYLACEAIGAGTCAVAAYNQKELDQALGLDGSEEFTIYTAPVGKVKG